MFGFSNKAQRQATAQRLTEAGQRQASTARGLRTEAATLRRTDARCRFPDPQAVTAIAGGLEANARICAANARDLREAATQAARPWWR